MIFCIKNDIYSHNIPLKWWLPLVLVTPVPAVGWVWFTAASWGVLEHPGQECNASCMKISQSQQKIWEQSGHSYKLISREASKILAHAKQCWLDDSADGI